MQLYIQNPTKEAYNNSVRKISIYAKDKINDLLANTVTVDTKKILKDVRDLEKQVKELMTKIGTSQYAILNYNKAIQNITKPKVEQVQKDLSFLPKIKKRSFTDKFLIQYREADNDKEKTKNMNITLKKAYDNIKKILDGITSYNSSTKDKITTILWCIQQMKNIINALDIANGMILDNFQNVSGKKDDFIKECEELAQQDTDNISFEELPSKSTDFENYVKNNNIKLPDLDDLEAENTLGETTGGGYKVNFEMTCNVKTRRWSANNVKFTGSGFITSVKFSKARLSLVIESNMLDISGYLKGKSSTYSSECFILFEYRKRLSAEEYKEWQEGTWNDFTMSNLYNTASSSSIGAVVSTFTIMKSFSCLLTYSVREKI